MARAPRKRAGLLAAATLALMLVAGMLLTTSAFSSLAWPSGGSEAQSSGNFRSLRAAPLPPDSADSQNGAQVSRGRMPGEASIHE
jgi:hypothetical protein